MFTTTPIEFQTVDQTTLRGQLRLPAGDGPHPGIVMSHGFAAVIGQYLPRFADAFAGAGFAVLLYDHRNFGASDGTPRQDIDPFQQVEDTLDAVTALRSQPTVDPDRIGLWGTSYSGGHAMVVGARDPRVACVVAQVPTISGEIALSRRIPPVATRQTLKGIYADREAIVAGKEPATRPLVDDGSDVPPVFAGPTAAEFMNRPGSQPEGFVNAVTVQSLGRSRTYNPGEHAHRISPRPLKFIVADHDPVAMTDLQLELYERLPQPKSLTLIRGEHWAPYDEEAAQSIDAAIEFFTEHLIGTPASTSEATAVVAPS
ncbi:alpha/beta hydrolase [Euzebya tangerina]|uniref:alpha/beta hydrolase n=1 Tax=Euzebya tangerina TaxID=591198 RepID=UPI000E30D1B3|nr:alpha/beta hydrolase [Euzebya tangerina]